MKNPKLPPSRGFSLVEVIITIAILGILSAIAIPVVSKVTTSSKKTVALNLVETLNNATKEFGHAQYELISSENTDSTDEIHILQTLQWKDPSIELGVAGPFMREHWVPAASNDTDDYRAVWAGSFWKLAEPGEAGAGLKVDFEANDIATKVTHAADFTPFPRASYQADPVDVSLDSGSTLADAIGELFETGVEVSTTDDTSTLASIEQQVGDAIAEELSNQFDLTSTAGEVTVEVDDSAANSAYADQLADALTAALLGHTGSDDNVTQQASADGETVTITASIPTETNEQVTATATITVQDVSTANNSITELSALLLNALTAADEAETSGANEVAQAASAAVGAAQDAAVAANAVADGNGSIEDAQQAAEAAALAATAAQQAADQVTDPEANLAAQEAATAAKAAADAANQVVASVDEAVQAPAEDGNALMDQILNAFADAFED